MALWVIFIYIMPDNTPVSIWRTSDGLNDNVYTGLTFIVDETGSYLVDTNSDNVIDTGIEMPDVPVSVWKTNNGV